MNRPAKAVFICSVTPDSVTVTLGSLPAAWRLSIAFWISVDTPPVSLLVVSAEMVAAGDWSTRLMRAWLSTGVTVATVPSGILPAPTGIWARLSGVRFAASWR